MPGRKEQNKRDLKKASANCYQLGIRKKVNESKNSFLKIKTDPPKYLRILQIGHRIYHAQVKRTILHALNISEMKNFSLHS